MVLILFILVGVLYLLFIINKKIYKISNNSVLAFTGGLGSGKTLTAVNTAVSKHRKHYRNWWINQHIAITRKQKNQKLMLSHTPPLIYSNVPVASKYYVPLTKEHLILELKIHEKSIVIIDEVGQFASQYDWENPLVKNELQEFIRFYRHYIDGTLIITDQNSDNIVVAIRRRINVIYNLNDLVKLLPIPYFTLIRTQITPITITEGLMTVEKTDVGELQKHFVYMLITKKWYESRMYKHRYDSVPYDYTTGVKPDSLFTNDFIQLKRTVAK
jgi:hypothetical protein